MQKIKLDVLEITILMLLERS